MEKKKIKVSVSLKPKIEKIDIDSDFIRLDSFLKYSGAAETGGHAKFMIQNEMVLVNEYTCTMRGKKLLPGDKVECESTVYEVVKRAD